MLKLCGGEVHLLTSKVLVLNLKISILKTTFVIQYTGKNLFRRTCGSLELQTEVIKGRPNFRSTWLDKQQAQVLKNWLKHTRRWPDTLVLLLEGETVILIVFKLQPMKIQKWVVIKVMKVLKWPRGNEEMKANCFHNYFISKQTQYHLFCSIATKCKESCMIL